MIQYKVSGCACGGGGSLVVVVPVFLIIQVHRLHNKIIRSLEGPVTGRVSPSSSGSVSDLL